MATAISIAGITKSFPAPGGGTTTAVNNVSLEIAPGELFFLLGPSGCGKTTLLRMIAGFIEPTGGAIRFDGKDVSRLPPNKRNTGMVFQSYALWPHMTVEANVAFGLNIRGIGAEEKKRRIAEALESVHMAPYAQRKPNQLSGGQQQRIALARALVIRPDVLLLDEPLSNLDAKLRIELRSEIRRICKDALGGHGITTIYVTHDQKEALSMADRVAIMDMGQVAQVGTPRELYRRPASRFVAEFLGETNFIDGTVGEAAIEAKAGANPPTPPTPGAVAAAVDTIAGRLVSESSSPSLRPGAAVTCSIRPEALRLVENGHGGGAPAGPNRLSGRIVETTYLGELAQHIIELQGRTLVKVAELNPLHISPRGQGGEAVTLSVDPADVVLLPANPSR